MKNKQKELDVDFIGGKGPLTKEDEATISQFIRKNKAQSRQKRSRSKSKHKA